FSVYADFFSYHGGIYSYTTGAYQGGHAVLIVGYDDVNQCFIVKNSWGTGWGESGYFRIAYNQMASPIYFGSGTLTYYGTLTAPAITVTKPASGASWQIGTTQAVSWTFTGDPGSFVKIDLWKGGAFIQTLSNSTSITSSFSWSIPAGLAVGSDYLIVVSSTSNASISGRSPSFSITTPPPVEYFNISGAVSTGLSGVTMNFSRVSGTGTLPSSVMTGIGGLYNQSGFVSGTSYKVTPSKSGYSFTPASLTFTGGSTSLNFTATVKGKKR
ncbi:MAG TPA: C1 family peptidase, partial [Thermodesulfobacteriota bacterium]|nr:C1 family peptidase [Thermodesulfobacteriota bacterium]